SDILFEARELRRAGNRHDPRPLCEQPRKRDLRGRGLLSDCHGCKELDERPIRFARLRFEARKRVAEVVLVERRRRVDTTRQETLAERAEGDEADAELFERRDHVPLGYPVPERILALQRGDWLNGVRTTDGLRTCLGETEVSDLPFANEILHGFRNVFDG